MRPPTSTDRPYPRIIAEAKCEAHTKVPQCLFCGSYHEVIAIAAWRATGEGPTVYNVCAACGGDVKAAADEAFAARRRYLARKQ